MSQPRIEIGERFTRLVVTRDAGFEREHGPTTEWTAHWYECECDCGRTTRVRGAHLVAGEVRSCGCLLSDARREILLGMMHGALLVVQEAAFPETWIVVECACNRREKMERGVFLMRRTRNEHALSACRRCGSQSKLIVGERIGSLVVVARANDSATSPVNTRWKLRCDCGREEIRWSHHVRKALHQCCKVCRLKRASVKA